MNADHHRFLTGRKPGVGRSSFTRGYSALLRLLVLSCFAGVLSLSCLSAQDVIFLRSGEKRSGLIAISDANLYRLQIPLPVRSGLPPAFASVSIPKSQVSHIEFSHDQALEAALAAAEPEHLAEIAALWSDHGVWLDVPNSSVARIGTIYGDLLLRSGGADNAKKALDLFRLIESKTWSDADRLAAKHGRLRAMLATGSSKDAVGEAELLAASTEDPAVLIEAKFLLAEGSAVSLKKLLEDNPRWREDPGVIPERNRLYHETLDLYLYPSLFEGASTVAAARGLWGAAGIYLLGGEPKNALECARDIAIAHPGTEYAALADRLIASLPNEPVPDDAGNAPANAPAQKISQPDKPKKKSHVSKKPKNS